MSYHKVSLLCLLALPLGHALPADSQSAYGPPGYGEPPGYGPPTYGPGAPNSCSSSPGPGVEHHGIVQEGKMWPYQTFKSSPKLPPFMQINRTAPEPLAPGLIFFTQGDFLVDGIVKYPGAYIFTDEGQLVWSSDNITTTNFKWQEFNGRPTMTYWEGDSTAGGNIGHGYGNISFLDNTYKPITVFCPDYGLLNTATQLAPLHPPCQADLHESYLTDRNTLISSAYNATQMDLTSVGGPADGWVWDCQFRDVNPLTGEVLFEWSSLDHVPISASYSALNGSGTTENPYDYFHINSVVNVEDGHYLVNGRHTWSFYYVDSTDGSIEWQFSGHNDTTGDFGPLPDDGHFRWQHHIRPHNITEDSMDVSIFNNYNSQPWFQKPRNTTLLVYTLPRHPEKNSTKSQALLKRVQFPYPVLDVESQGSYQPDLKFNGHQFATFGQDPRFLEFNNEGQQIWSGRVGDDSLVQVYRGFKQVWHATPHTKPDVYAEKANSTDREGAAYGYVSWNGATDVEVWNVYAGQSEEQMSFVGQTVYQGFETKFNVACWAEYIQVGAVEGDREVRRSEIVKVK